MESIAVQLNRLRWPGTWPILLGGLLLVSAWLLLGGAQLVGWSVTTAGSAPLTLLAATAMLLLPGLALLRLFWPDSLPLMQRWPLAIGISCALPPLLLLVSQSLGIRWNSGLCWGYLALSGLILIWPRSKTPTHQGKLDSVRPIDQEHLLLLLITGIAVMTRLYVVRDLPVGMWGDSYHHTVIAQLLVDNGGLFSSWQPYAPLTTFTYHYGFHSNVAWLSWLSGTPVTRSLLIVGQLQNALAVPLVYLLTRRLLGSNAPALWAALIVGFLSPMPAFYVNWGRYTQLAGQTVLPAVCVVWMALLDTATQRPFALNAVVRLLLPTVLITTGLALTHYRVALFAACFVLAYAAYLLITQTERLRTFITLGGFGLIAGIATLGLLTPWLINLRTGKLLIIGNKFTSADIGSTQTNSLPPLSDIFTFYIGPYVVVLALLGLILLLWQRQWQALVLVVWAGLVWLITNPYLIGLPGAGVITNFAVLIAGYLVFAPLAGAAISSVLALLTHRSPGMHILTYAHCLLIPGLLIWRLPYAQEIIVPEYQLFTPADAKAMTWIRQEVAPDAKFFVNSFTAYGGTLYAGSDGGWWLPFMTGRTSNLPPITYGSEAGPEPGHHFAVNATIAAIQRHALDSPEAAAILRTEGYRYLYDGPSASPPGEYIDPTILAQSSLYDLVYDSDGVTIWRVK